MTRTVLLGDICTKVTSGGTPSTNHDEYYNGNIPWLRTQEVDFGNIYSTEKTITKAGLANSSAKLIPENSVIIAMYGATAGKSAINKIPLATNQACCNLIINQEIADYRYVYYYLFSNYDNLLKSATGAAQQNLGARQIAAMPIELPELETQEKIANILGTLDEKIELNRKMNETLEQIGQALFRHYFIDNPEAGKWGKNKISELCDIKIGRTPPRKELEWFDKKGNEVWVSIKDMGQASIFISNSSEYLTKKAIKKFRIPVIESNTILLSFKLTVGRLCISTKRMYSNEAIAQLPLSSDKISTEYLYYFLRNFNYQSLSSTSSIATAVNSNTIKNIKISVPSRKIIHSFDAQARNGFETIKNNEKQIQNLTAIRDALLPRLINGELKI